MGGKYNINIYIYRKLEEIKSKFKIKKLNKLKLKWIKKEKLNLKTKIKLNLKVKKYWEIG